MDSMNWWLLGAYAAGTLFGLAIGWKKGFASGFRDGSSATTQGILAVFEYSYQANLRWLSKHKTGIFTFSKDASEVVEEEVSSNSVVSGDIRQEGQ